jgi:D-tyrosyl-tRNA(Tyr) deacylase
MRALVQRVGHARVLVDERVTGAIGRGLLVLLGAGGDDGETQADWTARKVAELRIFPDETGRMSRDVREAQGAVLVVPQFTLYGDVRRGRRPDFTGAARPEQAALLVERFCAALKAQGPRVEQGAPRRAHARRAENDGPVTLMIESPAAGLAEGSAPAVLARRRPLVLASASPRVALLRQAGAEFTVVDPARPRLARER